jgi:hypothetical protein
MPLLSDARGVGMMFVGAWRGLESDAEIALVTGFATVRADEKDGVKNVLQESFSSGPMGRGAGAVGTNRRFIEDSHDKHLPILPGAAILHPNLPSVATYRE